MSSRSLTFVVTFAMFGMFAVGCGSSSAASDAADSAPVDASTSDAPSDAAPDDAAPDDTTPADTSSSIDTSTSSDSIAANDTFVRDTAFDATLTGTPDSVYCFAAGSCVGGPTPICCDAHTASGFTDTCVATAAACNGDAFECDDGLDCFDGVCCAQTGFSTSGATIFLGSRCTQLPETGCKPAERQLCSSPGECSGNACLPTHGSGRTVGICQ